MGHYSSRNIRRNGMTEQYRMAIPQFSPAEITIQLCWCVVRLL